MGLFNKFEQKKSYILRKEGNERSPSTPPITANNKARVPSRPAHARRLSSAGLNMNGISCVVNDQRSRRPTLTTTQPAHMQVVPLDARDHDDNSDDSSAPSRRSDESEPRSLVSSATSHQSSHYDRDLGKPKIVDVSPYKSSIDFYDPYNYQSHGATYRSVQPERSHSHRESRYERSRSRPRQHQRNLIEDHGPEVVHSPGWNRPTSFTVHADRSVSARDMSACSRRHLSPAREPSKQHSSPAMRDYGYNYDHNNNSNTSYTYRSVTNDFARCQNNMHRDMFQQRVNNSRSRSRNRAATNSAYENDMEQRNRLSTGTKMDLAYKAGYEDALERAKADMLKHFRG